MVAQIFPVDFIQFHFSDFCRGIFTISEYLIICSKVMSRTMEQKFFFVERHITKLLFKIVQARYRRNFNSNIFLNTCQIFKLNFEAYETCEPRRATGSSALRLAIAQSVYVRVVQNFARGIQQCRQLNGGPLEFELSGFSGHFEFRF